MPGLVPGIHVFAFVWQEREWPGQARPPFILKTSAEPAALLPDRFQAWFAARDWSPRAHQLALLEKARNDRSALLVAPTGAGKTLAGFLPTLVELSSAPSAKSVVSAG